MAEKKSFLIYKSWAPLVMPMKDDQAGVLFKAVFTYQLTGEEPEEDSVINPMFNLFKSMFVQDQAAYEHTCNVNKRIAEERSQNKTKRNEPSRSVTNRNGEGRSTTDTDNDTDTDKDTDTEKDKDTDKDREKPKRTQAALVGESTLSDPVKDKLMEWLSYKKERREGYKETGLKSLITEVGRHEQESGSTAVINLINECMANGWRGIIWEKLKPSARSGTTGNFLDEWAAAGRRVMENERRRNDESFNGNTDFVGQFSSAE